MEERLAQLGQLSDLLIQAILAEPRAMDRKLSAPPQDGHWVSWSEDFLTGLKAYEELATYLVLLARASTVRFKDVVQQVRGVLHSALGRASRAEQGYVTLYGEVFKDYLKKLLRAVLAGEVEFTLCRRLIGVELGPERVELNDSICLVRLSEEELSERMPPLELLQYGLITPDFAALHRVEVRVKRREKLTDFEMLFQGPTRPRLYVRETERLQEAMLLMSAEGQLELGSFLFLITEPALGRCAGTRLSHQQSGMIFPPMLLLKGEVERLRECLDIAIKIQAHPNLKSALHRYTLACLRTRPEDSLVDLVIALESVLLQGLQNELSHRFSLNGSSLAHWVLGKPRKESYALFRQAYAARSSVVHGYGRKNKAARLESLSNELRHLLSHFLIWLIVDAPRLGFATRLEADDWLNLLFERPHAHAEHPAR